MLASWINVAASNGMQPASEGVLPSDGRNHAALTEPALSQDLNSGPHGPEPCHLGKGPKIAKYNLVTSLIPYNRGFPARTAGC